MRVQYAELFSSGNFKDKIIFRVRRGGGGGRERVVTPRNTSWSFLNMIRFIISEF